MSRQDRTRELATYASHLNFNNLPAEVMEKAKTVILDTIAVILAASRYPGGATDHPICTKSGYEATGNRPRGELQS